MLEQYGFVYIGQNAQSLSKYDHFQLPQGEGMSKIIKPLTVQIRAQAINFMIC